MKIVAEVRGRKENECRRTGIAQHHRNAADAGDAVQVELAVLVWFVKPIQVRGQHAHQGREDQAQKEGCEAGIEGGGHWTFLRKSVVVRRPVLLGLVGRCGRWCELWCG